MQKDSSEEQERVTDPKLPELFGGEQLEDSGFEEEIPEPDFKWRDPR
jgi:hypothetical protein